MREEDWYEEAACRDTSRDLFYSEQDADIRAALALCADCPVRLTCLERALTWRERFGVWGGTTESQRRRMFREAARSRRQHAA